MAISERRAVTVLLTEEHLRKMIEKHLRKENGNRNDSENRLYSFIPLND